MTTDPGSIRDLALTILAKKRDSAWDSAGTVSKKVSQSAKSVGTVNIESDQGFKPTVPLSHALGDGTPGQSPKTGTPLETVAGQSCIQCGRPTGLPGGREVVVRSTGTGQLAIVHQDCLGRWLARGPMPVLGLREI
jgi:hypothetical protein